MAKPPWPSCERIALLGPDPIALCVGIVTVVAALDATRPTHTPFGIDLLSAIQPVVVSGALHGVYARLVEWVCVATHSNACNIRRLSYIERYNLRSRNDISLAS